jgi:glycosyltransferase involved in cell wall biosynthesis
MYNSLSVLVSKEAGASSYLMDYYNGLTFDPFNIKNLAFALEYYKDENLRIEHGNNSLELLKESFDYEKVGKQLIKLIKGENYD